MSKKEAKEHILMNFPCLSVNEILDYLTVSRGKEKKDYKYFYDCNSAIEILKDLAKNKIHNKNGNV